MSDAMVELDISGILEAMTDGEPVAETVVNCGDMVEYDELGIETGMTVGKPDSGGIINTGTMVDADGIVTADVMGDGSQIQPVIIGSGGMVDIGPKALVKYPGDDLVELSFQEIQNRLSLRTKVMDLT